MYFYNILYDNIGSMYKALLLHSEVLKSREKHMYGYLSWSSLAPLWNYFYLKNNWEDRLWNSDFGIWQTLSPMQIKDKCDISCHLLNFSNVNNLLYCITCNRTFLYSIMVPGVALFDLEFKEKESNVLNVKCDKLTVFVTNEIKFKFSSKD